MNILYDKIPYGAVALFASSKNLLLHGNEYYVALKEKGFKPYVFAFDDSQIDLDRTLGYFLMPENVRAVISLDNQSALLCDYLMSLLKVLHFQVVFDRIPFSFFDKSVVVKSKDRLDKIYTSGEKFVFIDTEKTFDRDTSIKSILVKMVCELDVINKIAPEEQALNNYFNSFLTKNLSELSDSEIFVQDIITSALFKNYSTSAVNLMHLFNKEERDFYSIAFTVLDKLCSCKIVNSDYNQRALAVKELTGVKLKQILKGIQNQISALKSYNVIDKYLHIRERALSILNAFNTTNKIEAKKSLRGIDYVGDTHLSINSITLHREYYF